MRVPTYVLFVLALASPAYAGNADKSLTDCTSLQKPYWGGGGSLPRLLEGVAKSCHFLVGLDTPTGNVDRILIFINEQRDPEWIANAAKSAQVDRVVSVDVPDQTKTVGELLSAILEPMGYKWTEGQRRGHRCDAARKSEQCLGPKDCPL